MAKQKKYIRQRWIQMKIVLQDNPDIFPPNFVDEGLFLNVYAQVKTRTFGYMIDSCCIIPMADMVNHNTITISHETINLSLHRKGAKNNTIYFTLRKFMNNYSIVNQDLKSAPIYDEKLFEQNKKALSIENIQKRLYEDDLSTQIWEIPSYFDNYYDEDDTSSDEDDNFLYSLANQRRRKGDLKYVKFLLFF